MKAARFRPSFPLRGRAVLLLGLGLTALSACTPAGFDWINPALPEEQWRADYRDCRSRAERLTAPPGGTQPLGPPGNQRWENPIAEADREIESRQAQALTDSCMRGLGYVRASESPAVTPNASGS
ncbi:hypothetical protein [Telmatospirillum sp. J64-1]|uniref:hypothetical protein n=1 Tax=Telmatospirillum sp. J64-1 TaxID=2502183 RepID=UPI00115CE8A8|nr:hypothetical protein [Telmatospirillum sp. J64-1]